LALISSDKISRDLFRKLQLVHVHEHDIPMIFNKLDLVKMNYTENALWDVIYNIPLNVRSSIVSPILLLDIIISCVYSLKHPHQLIILNDLNETEYVKVTRDGLRKANTKINIDGILYEFHIDDNNEITKREVKPPVIEKKQTTGECLIYKTDFEPGQRYLMCSNRDDHVMDHEFMTKFKQTDILRNIKCLYCSHNVVEKIYEQY
jgi:hypothetical protein